MDALGWFVTASPSCSPASPRLGGALGGLAVPFMSMWIPPRDAVAVVLPILSAMDIVGIRVWRGKADRGDLRHLIPAALLGIGAGTLLCGVLSDRLLRRRTAVATTGERPRVLPFARPCGAKLLWDGLGG